MSFLYRYEIGSNGAGDFRIGSVRDAAIVCARQAGGRVLRAGAGLIRFNELSSLEAFASGWPMEVSRLCPGLTVAFGWARDRGDGAVRPPALCAGAPEGWPAGAPCRMTGAPDTGWTDGTFHIGPLHLRTQAEARQAIGRWRGDGWLRCVSDTVWRRGGEVRALKGVPPGLPLSGEWLDGEGGADRSFASVHLRRTAEGWSLTRLEERPGSDRITGEEVSCGGEQPDGQPLRLRYRTLWQRRPCTPAGESHGDAFPLPIWTPVASRFCGWWLDTAHAAAPRLRCA